MNLSQTFGLTGVVAALMVTGCATQPQTDSALREQLEAQQARVNELESQNAELQRVAANSGTAVQTRTVAASPVGGDGDLLPPNARPGECYARVFLPPRYETVTKQVVASEASEVVKVVPAKFGTAEERILVREAGKELTVIPAKFGMAEERVLVQEASERLEVVPAKYENVSERILVSPAQSYWKRGRGPVEKVDNMTGEIMCLIEEPAVYKTVTQRKLVTPAATRKVTIPGQVHHDQEAGHAGAAQDGREGDPGSVQDREGHENGYAGLRATHRDPCEVPDRYREEALEGRPARVATDPVRDEHDGRRGCPDAACATGRRLL